MTHTSERANLEAQIQRAQAFIDGMVSIYGADFKYALGPAAEVNMQRASIVHLTNKLNACGV